MRNDIQAAFIGHLTSSGSTSLRYLRLNNRTIIMITSSNPSPPGQTNQPPRLEYPTATQDDDANPAEHNSRNAKNRFITHS